MPPLQTTPPPLQHLPAAPHQTFYDNRQQLPPHQQFPQQQQLSTGAQPHQVLTTIAMQRDQSILCFTYYIYVKDYSPMDYIWYGRTLECT